MKDMIADNGVVHSLWADIVASRFELLLFTVSLIGYIVVVSSRRNEKGAKDKVAPTQMSDQAQGQTEQDADPVEGSADVNCTIEHPAPESMQGSSDVKATIETLLNKEEFEKVCDLFEMNYSAVFDMDIDQDMEHGLLMSALKCGRESLAEHLLQTSQTDFAKHVGKIQNWWRRSAARKSEERVVHMHDVLDRMAQMFNELHPFEEDHSDDESTCALGEDSSSDGSAGDSDWGEADSIDTVAGDSDCDDGDLWT